MNAWPKSTNALRRSRRTAWWASAVFVAIGVFGTNDPSAKGLFLVAATALFLWGVDYHRRLPSKVNPLQ